MGFLVLFSVTVVIAYAFVVSVFLIVADWITLKPRSRNNFHSFTLGVILRCI